MAASSGSRGGRSVLVVGTFGVAVAIASCAPPPSGRGPVAPPAASAVPLAASASIAPGAASASTDRFVLILDNTALYAKPSRDAAIAVPPTPGYYVRSEPYRLIATNGEWTEVETLGEAELSYERHCGAAYTFGDLRVHLFVATADLVPVTVRRLDFAFANGTRVSLLPGVALEPPVEGAPEGTERRSVRSGGYRFLVDLPRDAVGTSYMLLTPFPIVESSNRKDMPNVRPRVDLLFGDAVPTSPLPALEQPYVVTSSTPPPASPLQLGVIPSPQANTPIYREAAHVAGRLIELRTHCLDLDVVVPNGGVLRMPSAIGWGDGVAEHRDLTDRWRVHAGAHISWPDGAPAGVSTAPVTLRGDGEVRGDRRCFLSRRGSFFYSPRGIEKPAATFCFRGDELLLWPEYRPDAETAAIGNQTRRYLRLRVDAHGEQATEVVNAVRRVVKNAFLTDQPATALAPADESEETSRRIAADHRLSLFVLTVDVSEIARNPRSKVARSQHMDADVHIRFDVRRLPSQQILASSRWRSTRAAALADEYGDTDADVVKLALVNQFKKARRALDGSE